MDKAVDFVLSCMNFDGGFGCRQGSESHSGQVVLTRYLYIYMYIYLHMYIPIYMCILTLMKARGVVVDFGFCVTFSSTLN